MSDATRAIMKEASRLWCRQICAKLTFIMNSVSSILWSVFSGMYLLESSIPIICVFVLIRQGLLCTGGFKMIETAFKSFAYTEWVGRVSSDLFVRVFARTMV